MLAGVTKRVLVTGAAGALGKDVVSRFAAAGYRVVATDLEFPKGRIQKRVERVQMDLTTST